VQQQQRFSAVARTTATVHRCDRTPAANSSNGPTLSPMGLDSGQPERDSVHVMLM
jgi:hypothetical protein